MVPFLVFCGTTTVLVDARDEEHALERFNDQRLIPVDAAEVNVRPLRADDAGWINDSRSAPLIKALERITPASRTR